MFKLPCAVVGEDIKQFSVTIEKTKWVDDLKDAINAKLPFRLQCAPSEMALFLAKRGGEWLKAVDVEGLADSDLPGSFLPMKELLRIQHDDFSFPVEAMRLDGDVHVLVTVPKHTDSNVNAGMPSTPHPFQSRHFKIKIVTEDETEQPLTDMHDIDESTLTEFFSMYSTLMVKYVENVRPISESDYDLLSTMLTWVMRSFKSTVMDFGSQERRRHLIAPILFSVVRGFPGCTIQVGQQLDGVRVHAHVQMDFVIECGKKRICVIEVKEENFKQGLVNAILCCEVIADLDNTNEVYAIVTNVEKWVFLKSLDGKFPFDERNVLTFDNDGVPNKEDLLNIAGKVHSMVASILVVHEDPSNDTTSCSK